MSKQKNKTKIIVLLAAIVILAGAIILFKSGVGTNILWRMSERGQWILPLVVVSSLLDSINPCAFSVLILTIAFLFSLGKMRASILTIGGFYILGVFLIYLTIGLGILQTLHLFNTPHFMAKVGASLLIILGLFNLLNEFFPNFPLKLRIPKVSHQTMAKLMEKGSLPTAFLLGAFVGLCEFPCTGGPYLMVLGLLHDAKTFWSGLGYLILYNLIFVLPLIIILLLAGNKAVLAKIELWKKNNSHNMRLYGGLAVIILGLLILWL